MGCGPPDSAPSTNGFSPPSDGGENRSDGENRSENRSDPATLSVCAFGRVVAAAEELRPEEIKAILRRENELRLSDEMQRRFKVANTRPNGWITVVEQLQRQVLLEFLQIAPFQLERA